MSRATNTAAAEPRRVNEPSRPILSVGSDGRNNTARTAKMMPRMGSAKWEWKAWGDRRGRLHGNSESQDFRGQCPLPSAAIAAGQNLFRASVYPAAGSCLPFTGLRHHPALLKSSGTHSCGTDSRGPHWLRPGDRLHPCGGEAASASPCGVCLSVGAVGGSVGAGCSLPSHDSIHVCLVGLNASIAACRNGRMCRLR